MLMPQVEKVRVVGKEGRVMEKKGRVVEWRGRVGRRREKGR